MKRYKLLTMVLMLSATLAGCITVDSFLENLGLKRTDRLEQNIQLLPINQQYEFIRTGNVRSAPDRNALLLGTLKGGTRFFALGRTANNWIAIGDEKRSRLGYVHGSLVQKVGAKRQMTTAQPQATANEATSSSQKASMPTDTGVNLDNISDTATPKQGIDLDQF